MPGQKFIWVEYFVCSSDISNEILLLRAGTEWDELHLVGNQ